MVIIFRDYFKITKKLISQNSSVIVFNLVARATINNTTGVQTLKKESICRYNSIKDFNFFLLF